MSPGSSQNRYSIEQANKVGISGEIKVLARNWNNKRDEKNYTPVEHIGSFMSQDAGRNHYIKQKNFYFGIIYARF